MEIIKVLPLLLLLSSPVCAQIIGLDGSAIGSATGDRRYVLRNPYYDGLQSVTASSLTVTGITTQTGLIKIGESNSYGRLNQLLEINNPSPSTFGGMALINWEDNGGYAPLLDFNKSKSDSHAQAAVTTNDELGEITFRGSDGTGFVGASAIRGYVDGTTGTNDMPGRLSFWTTPDGAGNVLERMRIDNSGNMGLNDTSPDGQLEIISKSEPTGYVVAVSSQNDTTGNILAVLGNGNVGIGYNLPDAKLRIEGSMILGNDSDHSYLTMNKRAASDSLLVFAPITRNATTPSWNIGSNYNGVAGALHISSFDGSNDLRRVTINNGGNVGIGNTNSDTKLHISSGTITLDGTASPAKGAALCLTAAGKMSTCSTVVAADGTCTCTP